MNENIEETPALKFLIERIKRIEKEEEKAWHDNRPITDISRKAYPTLAKIIQDYADLTSEIIYKQHNIPNTL